MGVSRRLCKLAMLLVAAGVLLSLDARGSPGYDPSYESKVKESVRRSAESEQRAQGVGETPQLHSSDGVQVVFQVGHTGAIQHLAMSTNGRFILSTDARTVKLWDVASGRILRTFSSKSEVVAVGFSPDSERLFFTESAGQRLADGRQQPRSQVYEVATGREVAHLPVISSDARIGAELRGSYLTVTDLANGREWDLSARGSEMDTPIALSVEGSKLLTAVVPELERLEHAAVPLLDELRSLDKFTVWDVHDRRKLLTLPRKQVGRTPLLSPDGRFVVVQNADGTVDVHDFQTKAKRQIIASSEGVSSLVVTPDSHRLLVNGFDRSITSYDLLTSAKREVAPPSSVWDSSVVSPDGQELARAGESATEIYDVPSGTRIAILEEPVTLSDWAAFSPDHRFFAARVHGIGVRVWDIASGHLVADLDSSAQAFAGDSRTLILGSEKGGVPIIRDLATGRQRALAGTVEPINDVVAAANGRYAVTTNDRGHATAWDMATAQAAGSIACPGDTALTSITASPLEPLLAGGCMDGSAWLWDLTSGRALLQLTPALPNAGLATTIVRFSADGALLATGARDSAVVWNVAGRRKIREIRMREGSLAAGLQGTSTIGREPEIAMLAVDSNNQSLAVVSAFGVGTPTNGPHGISLSPPTLSVYNLRTGERTLVLVDSGSTAPAFPDCGLDENSKSLYGFADPTELGRGLEFTSDGRILYSSRGRWDVSSGQPAGLVCPAPRSNEEVEALLARRSARSFALSPDGLIEARGIGSVVRLTDPRTGKDIRDLTGHLGDVRSVAFTAGGATLVSGGADGSLRLWKLPEGREVAAFYSLGSADFVVVTPDQYYRASKSRLSDVSFRMGDQYYPFEQFDLRLNRPDIVLERLGYASTQEVQSYRAAHEYRLRKMGFPVSTLGGDLRLPQLAVTSGGLPVETQQTSVTLRVRSTDDRYFLDRLNVLVNDVPIFGMAGIAISERQAHRDERAIDVPLVAGLNKIQVSVLNQQGTESLRETFYTTCTTGDGAGEVYVVAIGVSSYQDSKYNLRFAAKDATDLVALYRSIMNLGRSPERLHVLDLTNEKATRTGILHAREWLQQTHPNDLAIVFAAGHGMIDAQQEYYFGTYDIDPHQPQVRGLPYQDFEGLFDGIPALKRLLLLDTCFSGEIEHDEPTLVSLSQRSSDGTVKMRAFKASRGVTITPDTSSADGVSGSGSDTSLAAHVWHLQDMFADLRRGTGAVVISSASGNEYALEGEKWNNGVFTYALLNGMKDGRADANRDGIVTVTELQAYVIDQVRALTSGGQNPTVRRENLDFDFVVYGRPNATQSPVGAR